MCIEIKNIKGTTGLTCACGSWRKHWENFSGRSASKCAEIGCNNTFDLVGAHVNIVAAGYHSQSYICILCKQHNNSNENLLIRTEHPLVIANMPITCIIMKHLVLEIKNKIIYKLLQRIRARKILIALL